MTKRIQSKYKIDRRYGCNLLGRPKSPVNKRSYGPGQHGQRPSKPSDYAIQLAAKQKLRHYYYMTERQFRNLYQKAAQRRGDTGATLIELLERRLAAVVYRMKLAVTPFAARQMISHGHILVNGKRVNIPSYQVRDGDIIELRTKMRDNANVLVALESAERDVPQYIEVEQKGFRAKFLRKPELDDVPFPVRMEPNLVIEYYSR